MKNVLMGVGIVWASVVSALSLGDFQAVHKARVTAEGPNQVHLELPSAEWDSGLRLKPETPLDLSRAKWLAVDVENLSATRQARLTLHLSVEVNHRLIDGLHLGRFYEALCEEIAALE